MAGTVTVACKLPAGLLLRVYDWATVDIPVMAGGVKTVRQSFPDPTWEHRLNGTARKIGQDVPHQIIHAAALTHGVDAEKFALWLEQNKDSDFVRKGLVFAQPKPQDVISQAYEHRDEKSGMEPIDPQNLPPEFKRSIETAKV